MGFSRLLLIIRKRVADLGPDPLRDDADQERVWSKMQVGVPSLLLADEEHIYFICVLFNYPENSLCTQNVNNPM